jgi:hypothetical protein
MRDDRRAEPRLAVARTRWTVRTGGTVAPAVAAVENVSRFGARLRVSGTLARELTSQPSDTQEQRIQVLVVPFHGTRWANVRWSSSGSSQTELGIEWVAPLDDFDRLHAALVGH